MLNCRQVTRLVSQSMDEQLPWYRRLAVRVHLLYCVWCRRYASQVLFLRKAARELAPQPNDKTCVGPQTMVIRPINSRSGEPSTRGARAPRGLGLPRGR
jgi:hypothetical protein